MILWIPAVFLLLLGASPDSSGLLRHEAREWKDQAGRIVKRTDTEGRMFLQTWDETGRLVRIGHVARRVKPGARDGAVPEGGEVWVHCFIYGEAGLIAEIDCRGERHQFPEPRALVPRTGTALEGHVHPRTASALESRTDEFPIQKFSYDDRNRVTSEKKE